MSASTPAQSEVSHARRMTRPGWINLRSALGLVLFAVAFLSGQRILAEARSTLPMWTAARDLPAYTEVTPQDLVAVGVRMPAPLTQRYADATLDLSGVVLTQPVREGEMIPLQSVSRGSLARAGRSLTIPVPPEQGLAADLRVGDRLDVIVTLDAGDVGARTLVLARAVEVVALVRASGLVGEDSSIVGVTVAVTPQQAVELAYGIRAGELDFARVEGAGEPAEAVVTGEDLR